VVAASEQRLLILLAVEEFEEKYRRGPGYFKLDGKLLLAFTHKDPDRYIICNQCWGACSFASHYVICNQCWGARSFASHSQHKKRVLRRIGGRGRTHLVGKCLSGVFSQLES
jgi:hypothetical protein